MQGIINFLSGIGDSIVTLFELLFSFLSDFVTFLKIISKLPDYLLPFFVWMPEELFFMIFMLIFIAILYKILGRD